MSAADDAIAAIDDSYAEFGHAAVYTPPQGAPVACTIIVNLVDGNARPDDGRPLAGQITIEMRQSEPAADGISRTALPAPAFGGGFEFQDSLGNARSMTVANRPILADAEGLTWTMWAE